MAKTNLSSSEERAQRELFWYREELFKMVRGRWREVSTCYFDFYYSNRFSHLFYGVYDVRECEQTGGTRSGDLSLRQQRMSLPMLERLRTETVRVKMSMYSRIDEDDREDAWTEVRRVKDKYMPTPYDFVYLRTRVTNLSRTSFFRLVSTIEILNYISDPSITQPIHYSSRWTSPSTHRSTSFRKESLPEYPWVESRAERRRRSRRHCALWLVDGSRSGQR